MNFILECMVKGFERQCEESKYFPMSTTRWGEAAPRDLLSAPAFGNSRFVSAVTLARRAFFFTPIPPGIGNLYRYKTTWTYIYV